MKRVLAATAGLVLLLGACSSANGESTDTSNTSTTTSAAPSSEFDSGDAVAIQADGFSPRWLVVVVGQQVTFTNSTETTQQIVFDNAFDGLGKPLQSTPIEPGGTWQWTADSFASFAYHSPQLPGLDGRIQVSPPAEND